MKGRILLTLAAKLHFAEERFNWRSPHLQPQVPPGLSLALILLRNVSLTLCLAENQLVSAAIAQCRKTPGCRPNLLICFKTDKNYTACTFGHCMLFRVIWGGRVIFTDPYTPIGQSVLIFPIQPFSLDTFNHSNASSPLSSVISPIQYAPLFPSPRRTGAEPRDSERRSCEERRAA